MIYRTIITLAVIAVLCLAAYKANEASPDVSIPATSSPDEAKFKGLSIN